MAFRVLGARNFPSHRTLCEFRRRHLEDGLFLEVWRAGLARFGKLSGTKVRANAGKRKAMVREEARRLKEEALLNAEEDARFGESLRGDELPEELRHREDRLAAAAKERAAQREACAARSGSVKAGGHRGEPEDKAQSNFTGSAKTGGFQHNAQVTGRASVDRCDRRTMQAIKGRGCEVKETFDEQPGTVLGRLLQ